jgi:hypothetical protein
MGDFFQVTTSASSSLTAQQTVATKARPYTGAAKSDVTAPKATTATRRHNPTVTTMAFVNRFLMLGTAY